MLNILTLYLKSIILPQLNGVDLSIAAHYIIPIKF